jgi:amino acid transporter
MTETDTTNSDALFLRAASGLTRLMSGWDVFIYNLGLICIGMNVAYTQRAGPAYYPNCSIGKATILAAACSIAVALGFWAWTSAAPRSGGIYVYLTRAGLPAIGFAVSFAECISWLFYLGITATMMSTMGLVPLAINLFGINSPVVHHVAGPTGCFVVASIGIWLAVLILIRGMESFLRWQNFAFLVAMLGTLALLYVLTSDPAVFHKNFNAAFPGFGPDPYRAVIARAQSNGWFGVRPGSLKRTIALMVWPFLALFAGACSMSFGGEVRRNTRYQSFGMIGSMLLATLVFIAIAWLANHSIGYAFQGAVVYNHDNDPEATALAPPVEPYLGYFACFATNNMFLKILICIGFLVWPWFWIPGLLMYASRVFFAWSLDRAAPKALAKLHPRTQAPYVAILTAAAISQVLLALVQFNSFFSSLVLILAIVGAWAATLALGVVFPMTNPELFQESPMEHRRILGIPLMSIFCAAGTIALVFAGFLLWRDPDAAGHPSDSLRAMAMIFMLGLIIHFAMRVYRRRQGIEITLGYEEMPIE